MQRLGARNLNLLGGRGWEAFGLVAGLLFALPLRAAEPAPADLEFFERRIRPLLVAHCLECHGAETAESSLRLDDRAALLAGGDRGPAVVPGRPDESLLVQAVRYRGAEIEMPPAGKLPPEAIAFFEEWVARGAPAPEPTPLTAPAAGASSPGAPASPRDHWAYRPLDPGPSGELGARNEAASFIDAHVAEGLARARLTPSEPAAGPVLVRRLFFDLWGLPPAVEDLSALDSGSPEAYAALVERLLAAPAFGERWARHWLDLVRYAESATLRGLVFHQAWRYRDYVIETFGGDRSLAQFLREQLAGDLLPARDHDERARQLVATTFLALGDHNLEEQDKRQLDLDVVDEQLDVIGKALLGQTITCARCHDHKFDPIPTRDYYALAGILRNVQLLEHANVSGWVERPLPLEPAEEARWTAHDARLAELARAVDDARGQVKQLARALPAGSDPGQPVAVADLPGVVVDDRQAKRVGRWKESRSVKTFVAEGYLHDEGRGKGEKSLTFAAELPAAGRYEVRLAYTAGDNRSGRVPVTVFSADGERTIEIDQREPGPIDGRWVSLGEYGFEVGGQCFVILANDGTQGHVVADAVQWLPPSAGATATGQASADPGGPQAMLAAARADLRRLEREHDELRQQNLRRPRVMTVAERAEIRDLEIHRRGSVHNLGEAVPRGFLTALAAEATPLPAQESGRRELAEWLVGEAQALVARVYVNRVWQWLLGEGLVRSVDNFGTTGEPPSHPRLLDALAQRFLFQGWSTKQLIREIVHSQTYRQSSAERSEGLAADPENRLLWRASRRRLEAECFRDAVLTVSGQLDRTRGGTMLPDDLANDYQYRPEGPRRSIYLPVLRNAPLALLEAFDFPDSRTTVGRRNESNVAPQALLLLNDPWLADQAGAAAERLLAANLPDDAERVEHAVRQVLGRAPGPAERALAAELLAGVAEGIDQGAAWREFYRLLFCCLDFRYLD